MDKRNKAHLLVVTLLSAISLVFSAIMPVNSGFNGEWKMEGNSSGTFILSLSANGNQIEGQQCIIAMEGKKIDCPLDMGIDLKTIKGTILGSTASVTFKSAWSDKLSLATIELVDSKTLKWSINKDPGWEHYFPKNATLKRQ